MNRKIIEQINDHHHLVELIKSDKLIHSELDSIIESLLDTFRGGNKVLICGNGGSAADAQHIATELSGRFYFDREPLNAEALHVNSSFITAVANDLGFEQIFSRALKAKANKNDVLISLSTSGNSVNVLNAMKMANELGVINIAMCGMNSIEMQALCTHIISIPTKDTPRIQEMHLMLGHIICQQVEQALFGSQNLNFEK